jgi:hypothetical protein
MWQSFAGSSLTENGQISKNIAKLEVVSFDASAGDLGTGCDILLRNTWI